MTGPEPFVGGTRVDVGGVSVSTDHYIGGRRVASASTFEDRSPVDWSMLLADVARGDAHTADLAVSAAEDAFPEWAAMGVKGRGDVMRRVADLIDELRESYAICIVTHSMQQAARVSQRTAYFHLGDLIEVGPTDRIFTNPRHKLTEDYITGRFG